MDGWRVGRKPAGRAGRAPTGVEAASAGCGEGGVVALTGFPFPVATSRSGVAAGMRIAARARVARDLLRRALGFTPRFSLKVLDRDDWWRHAPTVAYGVTHVAGPAGACATERANAEAADEAGRPTGPPAESRRLIAGVGPADAWQEVSDHFARRLAAPALTALVRVHGGDPVNGRGPALHALSEVLVAHDVAHLVAEQAGLSFPRRWLAETFANLALIAVLAESDPPGLRLVGSLADAAATLDDALPTLGDFDGQSATVDAFASVLAQLAITRRVYIAYAWGGTGTLAQMFSLFRGAHREPDADHELGRWLSARVHPAIATIPAQFSSAQRFDLAA